VQPAQVAEPLRFAPIVALDGTDPGRAPLFALEVSMQREAHVRLTCAIGALITAHQCDPDRPPLAVMVSLSLQELERLEPDSLAAALVASDIAPELLMIRVPQYTAGAHTPMLDRIAATGVTVVAARIIVGSSQVGLLAGAPVDMIELPAALVDDVDRTTESADRVEEWMAVAHRVDWLVLARNVRRPSQALALKRLGCDLAAGPLMGAPVEPSYVAGGRSRGSRLAG